MSHLVPLLSARDPLSTSVSLRGFSSLPSPSSPSGWEMSKTILLGLHRGKGLYKSEDIFKQSPRSGSACCQLYPVPAWMTKWQDKGQLFEISGAGGSWGWGWLGSWVGARHLLLFISLWKKSLPISWLIWTRARPLEKTNPARQHSQSENAPSTEVNPSLVPGQAPLSREINVQDWAGIS